MFDENSVDPDQTPRTAASDLGLQCLLMSLLWDAKLKWVNSIAKYRMFRITCFVIKLIQCWPITVIVFQVFLPQTSVQ